jgi:hypothetical protein
MERRDRIAAWLLVVLVLLVFWRAVAGGIFYNGDIYQLHYPLRSAYAAELARGSLPLWTTQMFAGYPLLAEGQLGALYPPNLILHALLPVAIALNVFILAHFVWAAIGAYAFARRLRLHRAAALGSALVYALGGFLVAHLNHVNIVACAAWLPWLFLLVDRLLVGSPSHPARDAAWLALALGMEFLAGHPQLAVLSLLALVAYAAYLSWAIRQQRRVLALLVTSLLLGLALAAAQLLPTYELTNLSVRSGGVGADFFTSFSLHPLYLVSLLSPFVLGNPYPETSVELVGYVGLLPLLLALLAPFIAQPRPDIPLHPVRPARFFAALAVVAVLLSFGRYNPLYLALLRLPVFNLFRVPGRYLYWFSFSGAVLAGMGLDALLTRSQGYSDATERRPAWWLTIVVIAVLAVAIAARLTSVDVWVSIWRWLPLALALLALAWMIWVWWRRRPRLREAGYRQAGTNGTGSSPAVLAIVALGLIVVDLVAFNAVYNLTYNRTTPLAEFAAQPRSLRFLQSQLGVYRTYTQEEIVPWLSVMRESFYPNLSLIHGLSSANGQVPLVPQRYADYTSEMTSSMLNLLGVKYYLIPQVLPVDEASESYDVEDPFAYNPLNRTATTPIFYVTAIEVESYVSHSVEWDNGKLVARITILPEELDETMDVYLFLGSHTAEWAYDRSDVSPVVHHSKPAIAWSFPARSGFPPEDHPGYVYRAKYTLLYPVLTQGIQVIPEVPSAYVHIERITLIDEQGNRYLLSHLQGKGDHTLVYRTEDVAILENNDVLPRVFMTYAAQAVPADADALSILRSSEFDPRQKVLLATDRAAETQAPTAGTERVELVTYDSRQVVVSVQAPAAGYLVLTDAWYPGWQVRVDGQEAPLLRADLIFRAVYLGAGEHTVEFTYAPASFRTGLLISAAALVLVAGFWLWGSKKGRPAVSW